MTSKYRLQPEISNLTATDDENYENRLVTENHELEKELNIDPLKPTAKIPETIT